jgi:hypothetical protein
MGAVGAALRADHEDPRAGRVAGHLDWRAAGALAVLAVGVNVLGQVATLAGDFAQASSLKAEADAVREATGTQVAHYGALVLAAPRCAVGWTRRSR